MAMLYGKASLDEYTLENIDSPRIKEMMRHVRCVQNPELDRVFPRQWPASVEVVTGDRRRFSTRIDYPKGDPENPLTGEELLGKFHDLASAVCSDERRQSIVSRVRALEQEKNTKELCALLAT